MSEVRVWPDGSTATREEAEAKGLDWGWGVCLYTEPVEDKS
jgi:hypothetical protein